MRAHLRKMILALLVAPIALWAADRQVGNWKVNLEKSKYTADHPAPKSLTVKIEEQEGGIKLNADGEDAQGNPMHLEYSAKYDGKEYPETGQPTVDTVALRRVDADTIESTNKKNGELVSTIRSVVSADGKTRTSTWTAKNSKGVPETWTVVFDKQ